MAYTLYVPPFPLSQYITCLWFQLGQTTFTREKILPTGTIELMINLGSPHKVVDKNDFTRFNLCKNSWLAGFQTEYIVIEAVAETQIMGIRFKPGGAYPFFDFPISELNDRVIELDLIWGHFIHEIQEKLFDIKELSERFRLLEEMLLQKLRSNLNDFRTVQFAVNEIARLDGFTTIKELSGQMGLSQKHLISLFNKIVGVSPKMLQRIIKFNHVLQTINPAHPVNWAEIAHRCHYYDQAHFNRDFLAFSGFNPGAYLQLRQEVYGDILPEGNDINMLPID